jgi:hypothetical protein
MNTTWTETKSTSRDFLKPVVQAPRMSAFEFQTEDGKWHFFELLHNSERIIFGGMCNVGFLESGYIEKNDGESLNETLQELLMDLQTYYDDGPEHVSRIVCNERM